MGENYYYVSKNGRGFYFEFETRKKNMMIMVENEILSQ